MKKKNRFLANKTFVVFSILAVCIILTAVFAPVVTRGVDPLKGSLVDALLPPCKEHIFGTDKMGRDIFSRVIYGARASLSATFGVVALIFLVGTVTGVLAGYFGGVIDAVIMRIADMMLAFPGLVLALAVAGISSDRYRFQNTVYAVSIYASKCTSYTDHYCCDRYRFHDAGTGSNVLPGIWREAAGTGMGLYAE